MLHHASRVIGEHSSRFRQRDLVHVAREERRADLVLELLDALTDGRLRAADALGGARKGAFFDDGEEVFELQQIHNARSRVIASRGPGCSDAAAAHPTVS